MENKFTEGLNNVFKLKQKVRQRDRKSEFLFTEHFLLGNYKDR